MNHNDSKFFWRLIIGYLLAGALVLVIGMIYLSRVN